jgi:tetratricopeptide (TPR) repeat protein
VGHRVITNAHVANAGKIFVELGPARVPAKVEKIDDFNDLAVLSIDVEVVAKPLTLAENPPAVGETVYAIGNPEGLEKTISQGLVSGSRLLDGRQLLQITASLSHGSSGGPIFNSHGEVVGVAVGALREGQNLNFAVPVSLLRSLLKSPGNSIQGNALATLEEVERVSERRQNEAYSNEQNSPWQADNAELDRLLHKAFTEAGTDASLLLRVSRAALYEDTDLAVDAAQRAVDLKSSPDAEVALAESLDQKAQWTFNDDNTKGGLLARAEKAARSGVAQTRGASPKALYVLAGILEDQGNNSEAMREFQLALYSVRGDADEELAPAILRGLARCSFFMDKFAESQRWFDQLVAMGKATAWDWSAQADRLSKEMKFPEAAKAYQSAAELGGYYGFWCEAATSYAVAAEKDSVLFCARKCIDAGTGVGGSESNLATAHRQIAEVLNDRGVYLEALSNAKEATALDPNDAFAYDDLGAALTGLHRNQEALNAFQQAIRLSDGRYAWMQFEVGSVYFDMENWEFARQSFQKAAELNPKDAAAAYNVAICYAKQNYFFDAAKWYEEYLRRNPNATDKEDILNRIRILRGSN